MMKFSDLQNTQISHQFLFPLSNDSYLLLKHLRNADTDKCNELKICNNLQIKPKHIADAIPSKSPVIHSCTMSIIIYVYITNGKYNHLFLRQGQASYKIHCMFYFSIFTVAVAIYAYHFIKHEYSLVLFNTLITCHLQVINHTAIQQNSSCRYLPKR